MNTPERVRDVQRISPDDSWWPLWLSEAGVEATDDVRRPGIGLDSQVTEATAAIAGHGVALMTPLFWKVELAANRLVQPFEKLLLPGVSYWLVYPEHKRTQSKIRAFREWLLSEMKASAVGEPANIFTEQTKSGEA